MCYAVKYENTLTRPVVWHVIAAALYITVIAKPVVLPIKIIDSIFVYCLLMTVNYQKPW